MFASLTALCAVQQAVVVGVNRYADEGRIAPLSSAVSDAQGFANILMQGGYECRLLLDKEATKEQITEAFIGFEQRAYRSQPPDILLFYFSGRGTRVPDDIQADETLDSMDECLLPSDAVVGDILSYIRDDTLTRWINAINAKKTLIILDCSFWKDDSNPAMKGFGELNAAKADAIELIDGLPENTMIATASSPEGSAMDGVYTPKLLEACSSEDANIDGDRRISFVEAHQYAAGLIQGQQPQISGRRDIDISLSALPVLSRLQINSRPEDAEIIIYSGSKQSPLDEHTPSTVALKKGKYGIQAQKPGYIASDIRQVSIDEYDKVYIPEPIVLTPIKVVGRVNLINSKDKAIGLGGKQISLHVFMSGEDIYSEQIPAEAQFRLGSDSHPWLAVGSEYELTVKGPSVISSQPVLFTYNGYSDIQVALTVRIDDIPPVFQSVALENDKFVPGDELKGLIKVSDDGNGMAEAIEIQFQSPDGQIFPPVASSGFIDPDTYELKYVLPGERSMAGKWKLSAITASDVAGNVANFSANQIKAGFTMFGDHYALGRYYFDADDYASAMAHFDQFSPKNDEALYMIALTHYYQKEPNKALATFQEIKAVTDYVGNSRKEDMPKMPRMMVNRLWGRLLTGLKDHQKDARYIGSLAATAEEN